MEKAEEEGSRQEEPSQEEEYSTLMANKNTDTMVISAFQMTGASAGKLAHSVK